MPPELSRRPWLCRSICSGPRGSGHSGVCPRHCFGVAQPCFEAPQGCDSTRGMDGELSVAPGGEQAQNSRISLVSLRETSSLSASAVAAVGSFLFSVGALGLLGGPGGISPCCVLMEQNRELLWAGGGCACLLHPACRTDHFSGWVLGNTSLVGKS